MATKLKETVAADAEAIADAVAASAQQIWQAGLGAFAAAQRDGSALFDSLVRDGAPLHKLTQDLAGDKGGGIAGKVGQLAESIGRQAAGPWDRIEKLFEDRVARALHSLGVPSSAEFEALRREIADLRAAMPQPAAKRAARSGEAGAAKPARKPARRAAAKPATGAAAARARS